MNVSQQYREGHQHQSNTVVTDDGRVRVSFRSQRRRTPAPLSPVKTNDIVPSPGLRRKESIIIDPPLTPVRRSPERKTPERKTPERSLSSPVTPVPKTPERKTPERALSAESRIEIVPGFSARLRGAQETWASVEEGFYQPVTCMSCTLSLCCILDADFVICPCCRGITPITDVPGDGGVGLGITVDDVQQRFDQHEQEYAASEPSVDSLQESKVEISPVVNNTQVSLYDIFPPHIAEALREGREIQAEEKESVTM